MTRNQGRIKKSSEASGLKRELAALKRELKTEVKSAREAATRAKKFAAELKQARADVARAIAPLLAQQEELSGRVEDMDTRWMERVQEVAETVLANLRETPGPRGAGASSSGTRASPLGRIVDEGLPNWRLPGSFETGRRR
jgi:hypothetical protein